MNRYRSTHLKQILDEQGRKRKWLAKEAGISYAFVRAIERGERTASEEVALRIVTAIGVPLFLVFELADARKTLSPASTEEAA